MFRCIVVGCDGTDRSHCAIELAEQLRDPDGGRLILVSVFALRRGFTAPVAPVLYAEWLHDQADATLDDAAECVSADVPFERHSLAAPSAAQGLNDIAEGIGADLVVLGPSHRHEMGRLTGRTTVQRLLHGAPCAIAVAAPDQAGRFEGAATIAVAYDGSDEAMHARDTAYAIAAGTRARVRLCAAVEPLIYATGYVAPVEDARLERSRTQAANASLIEAAKLAPAEVQVDIAVGVGAPAPTVARMAGPDVSLLVAGSRGYGTLHRAISGGVSDALLTNGRVPVLVTPRASIKTAPAAPDTVSPSTTGTA